MPNEDENQTTTNTATTSNVVPKPAPSGKVKYIIIGVVVLLILGVGGIFLSPLRAKLDSLFPPKQDHVDLLEIAFLTMPELIVNLKATKNRGNILKATFVFEMNSLKDKEEVDHMKPLLIDQFQTYLRELEITDLQGSAGIERVRQALFSRVNATIAPFKVRQVLIKDFLIQ